MLCNFAKFNVNLYKKNNCKLKAKILYLIVSNDSINYKVE